MNSIHRKILVVVVFQVFFILCSGMFLSVRKERTILYREMEKRAMTLMRSLKEKCKYAITIIDSSSMEQYIDRRSLNEFVNDIRIVENDVVDVMIINRSNNVLSSFNKEGSGREILSSLQMKSLPDTIKIYDDKKKYLTIISDIRIEKIFWGMAVIRFSLENIEREIVQLTIQTLLVGLFTLIFGACFAVLMIGSIVKPLRQLKDTAEAIGNGNLELRIKLETRDELGQLAKSFNIMAGKLQHTMNDLEMNIAGLENSQKLLAESEKNYRDMYENAIEGIFQVSPDGSLLSANNSMASLFGFTSPKKLLTYMDGSVGKLFMNDEALNNFAAQMKKNSQVIRFESMFFHIDGTLFWGAVSARKVFDGNGKILYYEGNMVDVSERKEKEKAQQQRLAAERAREVAEAGAQAKSEFLANMSHELRTPMNAIIGFAHLMFSLDLNTGQRNYLMKIISSAKMLLGVINDILDYSKIEAGKLEMEHIPFRLDKVLEKVNDLISVIAEKKDIEFLLAVSPDVPQNLMGDPVRLGQVITNLANNAVKFTEHGEVVVFVEHFSSKNNQVELKFTIQDTGIGLTREQSEKLFSPFIQADSSTTRQYGGTGLGLSICKHFIQEMRGKIWLESEPGAGTAFFFTAEFTLDRNAVPVHGENVLADLREMAVLVVEDNATAREFLSTLMESLTQSVDTAGNGMQALKKIEAGIRNNRPYDLILMDWGMPVLNGVETLHRMKSQNLVNGTMIILMATTFQQAGIQKVINELGLDGFLPKPVTRSMLLDAVTSAFTGDHEAKLKPGRGGKTEQRFRLRSIWGAKILLVEDNPINSEIAAELLKSVGMEVTTASNGRAGVKSARKKHYDLVLMDIQMPEQDGLSAAREIRKVKSLEQLPIVAMTAHAMLEDQKKSLDAGMNDHLTKPIEPELLYGSLLRWIKPEKMQPSELVQEIPSEPVQEIPSEPVQEIPSGHVLKISSKPGQESHVASIGESMELEGIDTVEGLGRVNGNTILYKKLLARFFTDYHGKLHEIRTSLENKKIEMVRLAVHTIKGIAGNIGARELYNASLKFETILGQGVESHSILFMEFSRAFNRVMDSLEKSRYTHLTSVVSRDGTEPENDKSKLIDAMVKMVKLLKDGDSEAGNYIETVRGLLIGRGMDHEIQEMVQNVVDYEFDKASDILQAVAKKIGINIWGENLVER